MSFTNLSVPAVVLGLAALAGASFLLQRLRVRHRDLTVVTTLFWKQAVEETRARVFVQRFRHPWAYLLVLAIASLLWLGLAGPRFGGVGEREYVLLLDTSAGMAWGDRFERATAALVREAERIPSQARRVIACGGAARTLLLPGEPALLLRERLRDLRPLASPAAVERELRLLPARTDRETLVLIFGDAPVRAESLALLDGRITVQRVRLGPEVERTSNRAVTALGVSAAASGAWNTVDVLCELSGAVDENTALAVTLDGDAVQLEAERSVQPGNVRVLLQDVPASGSLLRVELPGEDGFALDDAAAVVLPDRPLIRVALSPALDGTLRPLLEADPAIVLVEEQVDVYVGRFGESFDAARFSRAVPAALLFDPASEDEAFLVLHEPEADSHQLLVQVCEELGLNEIDAMGLAQAVQRPITVGAAESADATRTVLVWESLLSEEFNFVQSSAFPLFVARALRWLAGEGDFVPWSAAGVATGDSTPRTGAGDVRLDPSGRCLHPSPSRSLPRGRRRAAGRILARSALELARVASGARAWRPDP